jgi:hypothetical protein
MSCKNDYQATVPHTVYILIQNFKSELSELIFDKFTITKVSNGNYEEYEEVFTSGLYRNLSQYIIKREYKKIPPLPTGMSKDFDTSGFGNIPYESEDLIFLLRLFKEGDIVFKKQVIKKHDGKQFSQYKYPMVFSEYHSPEYYEMSDDDIPKFNKFFSDAPHWKGWNSSWFKISKNYFLWGSSKEFHPGRNDERILDYMISLEAVLKMSLYQEGLGNALWKSLRLRENKDQT